ncbi:MAG: hypothetical protein DWQ47_03535 [Acidobacteria bacterium]|nr:MAG: hypothetical protein DWQ32_07085 [Acidobacteriota bacterium]REK01473.1 MAG: hypothetical protein DWQ38_03520 [Acidobacteriota bacterium]REK14429.1 MAG: hypothetical protein DWQ43_12775 [Acidobacteriota bacterium]REK45144.1 MAG: hypothetical protein DWQ47_03535 [Acidobacteriota bacterium]
MSVTDRTTQRLERRLVVLCARTSMTDELRAEIRSILQNELDWDYVVGISSRNAVTPLVGLNLLEIAESQLPKIAKEQFEELVSAIQSRNLLLTAEMLRLVKLLEENEIEVLPFKGPVLAFQAYSNPCLRQYTDLDVLVHPSSFNAAVELLQENGFRSLTSVSWLEKYDWYVSPKKDVYLVNEDRSVTLELHWKLSGSHFGMGRMKGLWDQLETVEIAGRKLKTLPFYDNLVYLCLHGSRHSWERLQWICDVNELIRSRTAIDWYSIHDEAKHLGCEKVVKLGLLLVSRSFGVRVPAPFASSPGADGVLERMAEEIESRLFSRNPDWADMEERYHYHLGLKERGTDRWRLRYNYISRAAKILLTPNEKDAAWFPNLPQPFRLFLRPIRIVLSRIRSDE